MHVKEGNIALDLRRAECMQTAAVLIQMFSSTTEHTLMQIGTPFLSVPVSLTPLTLHSKFLISPIPWAVNCLDHARDVAG